MNYYYFTRFVALVLLIHSCRGASYQYQLTVSDADGIDSPSCNTGVGSDGITISPNVSCKSLGYALSTTTTSDYVQLIVYGGVYTGALNTNLKLNQYTFTITGVTTSTGHPIIDCAYNPSQFGAQVTPSQPLQEYSFSNIEFRRCTAPMGGAVYILSGTSQVTFTNCTFTNNHATQSGGAIFSQSYYLSTTSSTFKNNTAKGNGGALAIQSQTLRVTSCIFIENKGDIGGAIYGSDLGSSGSTTYIMSSNFSNNLVSSQGGAFFGTSTGPRSYSFFHSFFDNNCATSIYTDSYDVQVRCASDSECTIADKGNSTGCSGVRTVPVANSSDEGNGVSDKDRAIIIGVVVPFGVLMIISIALFAFLRKKHNAEMTKRDEYRKTILKALNNLSPEEQEQARQEEARADPKAPKCQLCQQRPINPNALPCGHSVVCSVCRTILLECPMKGCKTPTR